LDEDDVRAGNVKYMPLDLSSLKSTNS